MNGVLLESGIDLGLPLPHHLPKVMVGIILTLLVFLAMQEVVVLALEKLYEERYQHIEGGIRRVEQTESRAEAALAEYNDQLNSAREKVTKIHEETRNTGAQTLAEARERASKESNCIFTAGRIWLEAECAQLLAGLRADISGLATTLIGRIVGEALTDDERANRTIDRFLQELETAGTPR